MRALLDRESPCIARCTTVAPPPSASIVKPKRSASNDPKCDGHSVRNLNTLTYLIINVRALQKAKSIKKGILQMN